MSKSAAEKAGLLEKVAAARGGEWVDLVSTLQGEDMALIAAGMGQRLEVEAEELKRLIADTFHADIPAVERLVAFMVKSMTGLPEALCETDKISLALVALSQLPEEQLAKMLASPAFRVPEPR